MKQRIQQLYRHIEQANRVRMDRALDELLPLQVQHLMHLPVLLHYNHPSLPGYVSDQTPSHISHFAPSPAHLELLAESPPLAVNNVAKPQLLGLFMMGSSGTLGQCSHSDFDLWVCYHPDLSSNQIAELERKCSLLSQWAAGQDLEINFFLVNPEQFRAGTKGELSKESCGSTQHLLLLDEFYRSWISMAGLYPAWVLVPVEEEHNYNGYLATLAEQGIIDPAQWIDLGSIHQVPAEEYLGASLWQLHKSIESPYKSVLKTLLMEAYSDEYPQTETLAHQVKRNIHAGNIEGLALDSYYLMLEKVSRHLICQGDRERLDLARRSLYLKLCEQLSRSSTEPKCWRRQVIEQLVNDWQWSQDKLKYLDNRSNWKIEQVRDSYRELLSVLLQSYRNLTAFAHRTGLSQTMDQRELSVLTRKLYAAFEPHPEKIALFNLRISPDLHESDLTLIRVPKHSQSSNKPGWYLYKQPPTAMAILGQSPLEHSESLLRMLSWSHFNGLLTRFTSLHLHARDSIMRPSTLNQVARDLRETFPLRMPQASHEALSQPGEVRKLALFVNLETDPTRMLKGHMVEFDVAHQDAFSFGPDGLCLVGSIDLVYTNSWNEIFTERYEGPTAVLEVLTNLLSKSNQWTSYPQKLNVFCYSKYLGGLIKRSLYQLMSDCMEKRLQAANSRLRLHTIRVGGKTWGLIFEPKRVRFHQLDDPVDFYHQLSHSKAGVLSMTLDKSGKRTPKVVETYASEGLIQFFFEQTDSGLDVYVVDDKNRVETYRDFTGSQDELIQTLNRFYSMAHDRLTGHDSYINFNLPQYYTLQRQGEDHVSVKPYFPSRSALRRPPMARRPVQTPEPPGAPTASTGDVRLVGPKAAQMVEPVPLPQMKTRQA